MIRPCPVCRATTTYVYNALGQRVERSYSWDSYPFDDYFDAFGNLTLNVYQGGSQIDYLPPVAGRRYAEYANGAVFTHANALGSLGLVTDHAGNPYGETLYYPWGQTWAETGTGVSIFADMQYQDWATGFYFTPNRVYDWQYYRWMTPDRENAGAHEEDPQTWNAYAYVGNNPTSRTDPEGDDYNLQGGQLCDTEYECDEQGYVLNTEGNRYVVTDQEVLSGEATLGQNYLGETTVTEGGETFGGTFFDNHPYSIDVNGQPGSAAAAVGVNFGIELLNTAMDAAIPIQSLRQSLGYRDIPTGIDNASTLGVVMAMALPAAVPGGEEVPLTEHALERALQRGISPKFP